MWPRRLWRVALLFAYLSPAFSQAPPGAATRPELQPVPPPAAPPGQLELKLPQAPATSPLDAPAFVSGFRVVGAESASAAELEEVLRPWTGRTLAGQDLVEAAGAVGAYLRGKGLLLVQAFVPPQQVTDGIVQIVVAEGRLGQVRLEVPEGTRVRPAVAAGYLDSLHSGDKIRRDNVEQSMLILNDLPGVRLSGALAPGSEPGSADLQARLENDGGLLGGALTLDNAGVRGIGEYRANLDVRAASPLGFGDLFGMRLLQSSDGGQRLYSFTYGVPVNSLGTRIGLRHTEQKYRLGREFAPLEAHGNDRATSLLALHPLVRRSDRNLILSAAYTELEYNDRQDAFDFESKSRQRVAAVALSGDAADGWLGGGVTALQVQYLGGRVLLDTPVLAALDSAPGGLGVNGRFSVLRLRAQRAQVVDQSSSLLLSLSAQFASSNLDAGNEIAIGGPDAVRAYPVGELYADEGYVARAEYRRSFALFDAGRTFGSLFLDGAWVKINKDAPLGITTNKRSFSGYGFGLAQEIGRDVAIQSWFAWRWSADSPTAAPDRAPRVWVAMSARF